MNKGKNIRPKVSIVVPVYNVEKYLDECVNSILSQTLKDIEVILVDDGSPDNCGQMIDEYAKKDKRVVPVHQKNGGYSVAVNHGIDLAKGEYIGIIESDDWIEPDMYEKLYKAAKSSDADIAKGMFYSYNSTLEFDKQNVVFSNPSGIDLRLAPDHAFKLEDWPRIVGFHASIWSSIYKAAFVKKIKIPNTAGASYQDLPFMVDVMCHAKKIVVVKQPFVHWRNEPNQGNSTSAHGKKALFMAQNTKTALETIKRAGLLDKVKEEFFYHVFLANFGFYQNIDRQYKQQYANLLTDIFSEVRGDKKFHYRYFTPEQRAFVRALIGEGNWSNYYKRRVVDGTKRKLRKALLKISPSYRMNNYIKGAVAELIEQNQLLADEVRQLRREKQK